MFEIIANDHFERRIVICCARAEAEGVWMGCSFPSLMSLFPVECCQHCCIVYTYCFETGVTRCHDARINVIGFYLNLVPLSLDMEHTEITCALSQTANKNESQIRQQHVSTQNK